MTAMDMDPGVVALLAIGITAAVWTGAFALDRIDPRVTARGLRNGALIALGLFAVTLVIVTFVVNNRGVFAQPDGTGGAVQLGLLVGAVVALGYLWLGSVLIAIGLLFRSKPLWTTLGAWVAVPVIVVSLGFGYVSYRSVPAEGQRPMTNGSMSINVSNGQRTVLEANGSAVCVTDASGNTTIETGNSADTVIVAEDGRVISARVTLAPNSQEAQLEISVAGVDTADMTTTTAVASSPASGQILITAPSGTGTLTWSCRT